MGKNTYGVLNLYSYFPANEKLTIGNYVSIAPEVKFVLGGNHQSLTATTYPVKSVFSGIQMEVDSLSKGEIMVEDEVWIGAEAMILSGITLGKGCIVAARSVVTKDVPPYAIVGGNPARIIKYRFSEEVIRQLLPLKLINLPENVLKENSDLFYTPITSPSDLGKLLDLFATYSQPAR